MFYVLSFEHCSDILALFHLYCCLTDIEQFKVPLFLNIFAFTFNYTNIHLFHFLIIQSHLLLLFDFCSPCKCFQMWHCRTDVNLVLTKLLGNIIWFSAQNCNFLFFRKIQFKTVFFFLLFSHTADSGIIHLFLFFLFLFQEDWCFCKKLWLFSCGNWIDNAHFLYLFVS